MRLAVGFALLNRQATEPKVLGCRVADGPFACTLGQLHQADLLGLFLNFVDFGQCFGADFIRRRLRWQRLAGRNDLLARRQIGAAFACGQRFDRRLCPHLGRLFGLRLDFWRGGFCFGFRFGWGAARTCTVGQPRRCTLPITALRVTPPSSLAIWLADWPSPHIFFKVSTRSSVQDIGRLS